MHDDSPSPRPNDEAIANGETTHDETPTNGEAPAGAETPAGGADREALREDVERAVAEVRREGYKAALVYAGVDAAAAGAAVAFVATVAAPRIAVDVPAAGAVSLATAAGAATAALVLAAELVVRIRWFSIEAFERVNPEVATALRTARDAATAGDAREMAGALYGDVLDRLRATSSAGLVDGRRVAVALVLATLFGLGTIQAAVTGVTIAGAPAAPSATPTPGDAGGAPQPVLGSTPDAELRSPESILGEESDVEAGEERVTANVSTGPGLGEEERDERAYEASGLPSGTDPVSATRAGFDDPESVENAGIVRAYSVRVRDDGSGNDE